MDAYGNLTSQDEFSGGRRIRIISYLGEDLAIGSDGREVNLFDGIPGVTGGVALHHLSSGDPDRTTFVAETEGPGFALGRAVDPRVRLSWGEYRQSLVVASSASIDILMGSVFTVQFVDGVWFNLRTVDGSMVVDCAGSGTDEGQPLLGWDANGGDNQKWRAQAV